MDRDREAHRHRRDRDIDDEKEKNIFFFGCRGDSREELCSKETVEKSEVSGCLKNVKMHI